MPKKETAKSALTVYMHMIGSCRWVSRRTFDLIPMHTNWRASVLKNMQDNGYTSCKNMKRGRRFKLLEKGYEWLHESNPERYADKAQSMVDDAEYSEEKARRISLLGESYMMAELAGYSVHKDDKPDIRVISPIILAPADRPALRASAEDHSELTDPKDVCGLNNVTRRTYYADEDKRETGNKRLDTRPYRVRTTPIGCYYTMREMRKLSEEEVREKGGELGDLDAITRYSKASGLLFTGGGGYRVYNAEDTAIRIRSKGEVAMKALMETWCERVYTRSEEGEKEGYANKRLRGTVLFGDKSHKAAVKVISETWEMEYSRGRKKNAAISLAKPYNLIDMPETLFIPVIGEALPLYGSMIYPGWGQEIRRIGMDYVASKKEVVIVVDYKGNGYIDGKLSDGRDLAVLIALDLRRVMKIASDITAESEGVYIVCMDWQRPFFERFIERLDSDKATKITIDYAPSKLLFTCARIMQAKHNYDGVF